MASIEKPKKKPKKPKRSKEDDESTQITPLETEGHIGSRAEETPQSSSASIISVKEAANTTDNVEDIELNTEPLPSVDPPPHTNGSRPVSAASRTVSPPPAAASSEEPKSGTSSSTETSGRPASAARSGAKLDSRPASAVSKNLNPVTGDAREEGPRPGSATSQRSHKKNAVVPVDGDGANDEFTSRSQVLPSKSRPHSATSNRSILKSSPERKTPVGSMASLKEVPDENHADVMSLSPSTRGQTLGPSDMNEAHAYVPYLYARDCIARVMGDMKKMKKSHVHIVHEIENNYKSVENDTQGQFNVFVLNLRDQYGTKVKTFRQVVEVHRLELNQKQTYWDQALTSLSERNKKLLEEKRSLMIKSKIDTDSMEKEKGETTSKLIQQLDETSSTKKKLEQDVIEKEVIIRQKDKEKEEVDAENKRLQRVIEELNRRPEAARLVSAALIAVDAGDDGPIKPASQAGTRAVPMAEVPDVEKENVNETKAAPKVKDEATRETTETVHVPVTTVVVQELSKAERDSMEAERQMIANERRETEGERTQLEKERNNFSVDRKKYQEDRVIWQGDLNNANKDRETWKAKYQGLKDQLGDLAELRAKYEALQAQFAAVVVMASVSSDEDKKKADENIKRAENDKAIMEEERTSLEKEVKKWEEDFKEKNGREPRESEKTDSVKELETSLNEAQTMINSLDAKVDTLETLKRGDVPVAPEIKPQPINVVEPEIRIVEIKVPDPEIVAQLEMTQGEMESLYEQLAALKSQLHDAKQDNTRLQSEVADAVWDLNRAEATINEQGKKFTEQAKEIAQLRKAGRSTTIVAGARPGTAGGDNLAIAELERQLRNKDQEIKDLDLKHGENLKTQEMASEKKQKSMENDIKKLLKEIAKLRKKQDDKKDADPATVEGRLEKSEEKSDTLENKILDLETKVANLEADKALLNNINQDMRDRLAEYNKDLHVSEDRVVLLGAAAADVSIAPTADEVEDLQAKIKELEVKLVDSERDVRERERRNEKDKEEWDKSKKDMEKDMKKLLKHIAKLREQLKEAKEAQPEGGDSKKREKLSELEAQVSDLQADLDHSKESNQSLESRITDLEQELAEAEDRVNSLELKADLEIDLTNARDMANDLKERIRALEADLRGKEEEVRGKEREVKEKEHQMKDQEREHEKQIIERQKHVNEMTKDMKKLLKEIAKLRKKLAVAGGEADVSDDSEFEKEIERLEDKTLQLENQVADLEGDKKNAESKTEELEDKVADQENEISRLERELENERERADAAPADHDYSVSAFAGSATSEEVEELNRQVSVLQKQVDQAEKEVREEKSNHETTRDELEALQRQIMDLQSQLEAKTDESEGKLDAERSKHTIEMKNLSQKLESAKLRIDELDKARLANLPVDTVAEINNYKAQMNAMEKEKDGMRREIAEGDGEAKELQAKVASLQKQAQKDKSAGSDADAKFKFMKAEKEKEIKQMQAQTDKRERERQLQEQKKIAALEKKIRELEAMAAAGGGAGVAAKPGRGQTGKGDPRATQQLQDKLRDVKSDNAALKQQIKQMQMDGRGGGGGGGGGGGDFETQKQMKKQEKLLKELEKLLDNEKKKNKKNTDNLAKQEGELKDANKGIKAKDEEIARLKADLTKLGASATEAAEMAAKIKTLQSSVKSMEKENKILNDNFNSERVLRKKYYNMVEDMKGKIRVYCRVRPMSSSETQRGNHSVVNSADEYSIAVGSTRGPKDFQFDNVFMPESTQEKVFEDTNNLIQSAVDGYNVCIFAYGQTGSGKTFTIIGDRDGNFPGVAPRAFNRIYELLDENKSKFSYKVSCYMLELYNERLIDLFAKGGANEDKLDIKKDKKGMVVVQGSEIKGARNSKELYALFEEGSKHRHTASTKMNAESSRSHLVIGIVIETTNKATGQVVKGKLSLVDLAGSERAAKTGATAEQLKEAMSINKSLSALGDVISALSSEQQFIPYRNNKLTMLMQDSLGGNAKTLMFVNISPADYNADESVISLTYASRVKLITNDAQKNSDNKEIARLKNIVAKLKKGEAADDDDA